jgi:hypothetical protein
VYWALPPGVRLALRRLGGVFTDGRAKNDPTGYDQLAAGGPIFLGATHSDSAPPLALIVGRHVIYVDIVPKPSVLDLVASRAATLTLLDHHRSAHPAIKAAVEAQSLLGDGRCVAAVYDEDRSGAQLAWDWAHGAPDRVGAELEWDWAHGAAWRPPIIDYVAAGDLHRWKLPNARAACKTLYIEGYTRGFGPLSDHMTHAGGAIDEAMISRGAAYLRYEEQLVGGLVAKARPAIVAALLPGDGSPREYYVLAVNSPTLQSEIGEVAMGRAGPEVHFIVIWAYVHDRAEIWASVRTNRPDIDLSLIAPHIVGVVSGGGHPKAAGFMVPGCDITAILRPPQPSQPSQPSQPQRPQPSPERSPRSRRPIVWAK